MMTLRETVGPYIEYLGTTWWGKILQHCHTEPTELIMGGFAKWIVGTWLILPFRSFESSPTFAELGKAFPEEVWAIGLMTLGAIHLWILRDGHPQRRAAMSLTGFLIWFSLGFTFIMTNAPAFGAMLFFLASFCQGWCCLRLNREVVEKT